MTPQFDAPAGMVWAGKSEQLSHLFPSGINLINGSTSLCATTLNPDFIAFHAGRENEEPCMECLAAQWYKLCKAEKLG